MDEEDPAAKAKNDIRKGELVYKAANCCSDLLAKLGSYEVKIPEKKVLNIHLGIGSGTVYDVHVGGPPGRWEHFIAGEAVNQLSIVLDLAKPGMSSCLFVAPIQQSSFETLKKVNWPYRINQRNT